MKQVAAFPVQRSIRNPVSSWAVPLFEFTLQLRVMLEEEMLERLRLSGALGEATSGSGMRRLETMRSSYQTVLRPFQVAFVAYGKSTIFPNLSVTFGPWSAMAISAAFVIRTAGCPS